MVNSLFSPVCQETTTKKEFGLCDDRPSQPAYISEDKTQKAKWIATVKNMKGKTVRFHKIDHCIVLPKDRRRCEGMLTVEKRLVFIELKDIANPKSNKSWRFDAAEQIESTLNFYIQLDGTKDYKLEAHIAYPNRGYRNFTNYHVLCKKFYRNNKIVLRIHPYIEID